jgi:DNA mismatch repair protein MutS
MTIVEEYLSYTKKWKAEYGEKTLVLMQVGSFFEVYALLDAEGKMYGSNIQDFASINDMVISRKSQCVGNQQVMMAGFGIAQSEKYLKKLQEAGYTVAVYTQDAQTKNTTRSLSEIISPGTYFSQDSVELSNNILCIWLHKSKSTTFMKSQMTIGVSNIDVYTGKTSVSQFTSEYNHIPSTYDDLERYVSIYKPNECILISNLSIDKLNDIVEYTGIKCQTIHKLVINESNSSNTNEGNQQSILNAEKQIYQREIIKRFFPSITEETFQTFTTHYIAIQSLSFLLDFAYKHSPYLVRNLSEPVFENHTNKLLLANHSLKQLNMIDDSRHNGRLSSVYSLLNHCLTNMGKRSFIQILHNPTTCIEQLQRSYDITEHLLNNDSWKKYREKMVGLKDMEKFNRKLVYKKVYPKDLSMFVDDLQKVLSIYGEIKKDKVLFEHLSLNFGSGSGSSTKYNIEKICYEIIDDIQSKFSLQKCIQIEDMSFERLSTTENEILSFINSCISVEIDKCQKATIDSREKWDAIQLTFSNMISGIEKSSSKTAASAFIKSHETPKSVPLMVATKRRMALLKQQLSGRGDKMVIKYMSNHTKKEELFELSLSDLEYTDYGGAKKDMTVCNKQMKEMANEIQNSKDKWIQEISLFYSVFIEEFTKKYKDSIENIQKYIAEVDTICCKCYIANTYNYCKPVVSNTHTSSYFSCTGLRHPLIEHLQTRELYVTNDLTMSCTKGAVHLTGTCTKGDVHNTSTVSGILLYGTNAVGKTSFIKSIGIAIILAQAGLYVPCSTFTYYPYKSIFTRILGNDNIFKGLSTFAVEMSELRTILEQSDENSIVLGDELCSGTESHSALSIFTAGLEILHEKKCTFLFATHFHEIVSYDEIKKLDRMKFMHMAVSYVPEKGVLVYDRKLRDGPGDSMYGLEVCKSLNLPKSFLERAHDIRIKYNPNSSTILTDKTSHYNKKKIVGMCEMCHEERSTEVHHLAHQKNASAKNDYIDSFHKNHPANLLSICESCHKKFHDSDNNVNHRVKKTTSGQTIVVIS